MPLIKTDRVRESHPPQEWEEVEPAAQRLMPEPVEDVPMASGRPHQDFVENRLRQYLQDSNIRSLVKPTQEEIRSAAMPILC